MPYEFAENEFELEPAASSARYGGPPSKLTGMGVLDRPVPPKGPASLFLRVLGGLLLLGLVTGILFLLFAKR